MAAGKFNFVIEQGTTLDLEIAYKDSGSNKIDLTDYSGRMQIKDKIGGSITHITLSSSLADDGTGLAENVHRLLFDPCLWNQLSRSGLVLAERLSVETQQSAIRSQLAILAQ